MRQTIRYFGGKYKLAKEYGPPRRDTVIEPFAGGAGYSHYWNAKHVILVEKDPMIAEIWNWLINHATPAIVMGMNSEVRDSADFPSDWSDPMRNLVRLNLGRGDHPGRMCNRMTAACRAEGNARGLWNYRTRHDIAANLEQMRHWEIIHGDYSDAPDIEAHWHIDPPYQHQGIRYRHGSKQIDFEQLADWCRSRKGSGEVCEAEPADWLPFRPLKTCNAQDGTAYTEVVHRIDAKKESPFLQKLEN